MELSTIIPHIEALIFASDKPLTSLDIVELINNAFGFMEERISLDQVESAMEGIREKYNAEFYPFEVRESGGGWQFLTKKDFHKTVGQLNGDKFLKRLSNAALETLAIIAYKQPITKGEVESIRGVNSDYSVQKLLEKELIVISGRSEDMPGKPLVYVTSKTFMDYFGLNSVDDLPKIREVLAEQAIQGTIINEGMRSAEASGYEGEVQPNLTVTDNGELVEYKINRNAEGGLVVKEKDDEDSQIGEEENINIDETNVEETETGDEDDDTFILPMATDLEEFSDTNNNETDADEETEVYEINVADLEEELNEEDSSENINPGEQLFYNEDNSAGENSLTEEDELDEGDEITSMDKDELNEGDDDTTTNEDELKS